jgi:hypothetical protein
MTVTCGRQISAHPEHIRYAIELLHIAHHDLDGAFSSLHNDNDFGLRHHANRMFDALRLAGGQLKALDRNAERAG